MELVKARALIRALLIGYQPDPERVLVTAAGPPDFKLVIALSACLNLHPIIIVCDPSNAGWLDFLVIIAMAGRLGRQELNARPCVDVQVVASRTGHLQHRVDWLSWRQLRHLSLGRGARADDQSRLPSSQ